MGSQQDTDGLVDPQGQSLVGVMAIIIADEKGGEEMT